jgi:Lecithin retinol acyltransferase
VSLLVAEESAVRVFASESALSQSAQQRAILRLIQRAHLNSHTTEVMRRARSRLGEDRYRLLSNNCEHFCEVPAG